MEIQSISEGNFFHIFNRGVNGEDIFKEQHNYEYFLNQYEKYCLDILETYAYALLKNHFHLVVYVKEDVLVESQKGNGTIQLNASKQLSHFFNSYSQSINKKYNRTGSLFESPFERRLIDSEQYLSNLIFYCHFNPQYHQFVTDFKDWSYTSYNRILIGDNRVLHTEKVIDWFGGRDAFIKAHQMNNDYSMIGKYIIE